MVNISRLDQGLVEKVKVFPRQIKRPNQMFSRNPSPVFNHWPVSIIPFPLVQRKSDLLLLAECSEAILRCVRGTL